MHFESSIISLIRCLQTLILGNVIRALNDVPDSLSIGINLIKCEIAITEQNVIDPAVGTPIVQNLSGSLEYFDNETPAGSLLQGYDVQQSRKVDELSTQITDSWLISF